MTQAMRGAWRISGFPQEIWLLRGLDAGSAPQDAEALPAEAASFRLEEWFPETGAGRDLLVEIAGDVHGPAMLSPIAAGDALRAQIGQALGDGRLRAFVVRPRVSGGGTPQPGPQPEPKPQPVEQKTWIMVELMDSADPPKPVPMKRYRIELPDGSTREGLLDMNGQAMIRDIEPGTCKVSFPQLHAEDWQPA